jgi:hypothetical protein
MLQPRGHSWRREFSAVFDRNGSIIRDSSVHHYSFGAGRLRVGLIHPRGGHSDVSVSQEKSKIEP